MGNWAIEIHGVGVHNNTTPVPEDADRMAADFVALLKRRGHNVTLARVTSGSMTEVLEAEKYVAYKDAQDAAYKAKHQ